MRMPEVPPEKMVEADGGLPFSVVFFDGQQEKQIGTIVIYPSMVFKKFQSVLSNKIGISKNQFSTYLCNKSRVPADSSGRIPITRKVNFAVIMKERDCFFLVVMRRSRGTRRGRRNRELLDDGYDLSTLVTATSPQNHKNLPEKVTILKRNTTGVGDKPLSGIFSAIEDRIEYEKRVRNFQMARERYLMNMGLTGLSLSREEEKCDGLLRCEECMNAKMMDHTVGEFHLCIHDEVSVGFRSTAGPVARPTKGST